MKNNFAFTKDFNLPVAIEAEVCMTFVYEEYVDVSVNINTHEADIDCLGGVVKRVEIYNHIPFIQPTKDKNYFEYSSEAFKIATGSEEFCYIEEAVKEVLGEVIALDIMRAITTRLHIIVDDAYREMEDFLN